MEIEANPRTFSLVVTDQELTALTKAVESWMENATGEDTTGMAETLSDMSEELKDALEEE